VRSCGDSPQAESSLPWRAGPPPGYGRRPVPPGAGPSFSEQKSYFHDHEALTVCADCQGFMIPGICVLAGASALRAGLRGRKRSGRRGRAAAGSRSRRGTRFSTRTFIADGSFCSGMTTMHWRRARRVADGAEGEDGAACGRVAPARLSGIKRCEAAGGGPGYLTGGSANYFSFESLRAASSATIASARLFGRMSVQDASM
jgi:hypothetical protein